MSILAFPRVVLDLKDYSARVKSPGLGGVGGRAWESLVKPGGSLERLRGGTGDCSRAAARDPVVGGVSRLKVILGGFWLSWVHAYADGLWFAFDLG